jgi:hypothetical protein
VSPALPALPALVHRWLWPVLTFLWEPWSFVLDQILTLLFGALDQAFTLYHCLSSAMFPCRISCVMLLICLLPDADKGEHSLLVLFDFTTAFDLISHAIWIDWLCNKVCIFASAPEWLASGFQTFKCLIQPSCVLLCSSSMGSPSGVDSWPGPFPALHSPLGHLFSRSAAGFFLPNRTPLKAEPSFITV